MQFLTVPVGDSFDIESEISSVTSHGSFMSVVRAAKLAADQVRTCHQILVCFEAAALSGYQAHRQNTVSGTMCARQHRTFVLVAVRKHASKSSGRLKIAAGSPGILNHVPVLWCDA